MPLLESRSRNAFPVPPLTEVVARQPSRRHVMVQRHLRHVESARANRPRATEEFRLLLAEQRIAAAPELGIETANAMDERAAYRHVRAERDAAPILEDERMPAVVENGERAPEVRALLVQPRRTPLLPDGQHG